MSRETARFKLIEAALASSAQGVIIVDARGSFVFINEAGRQLLQPDRLPESPASGAPPDFELLFHDKRPVPPEETPLARALSGETVVDLQLLLTRPLGRDVQISITSSPAWDERGNIVGAICLFRNITERVHAHEERQRLLDEVDAQRRLFQMVVDNAPVGIAVLRGPNFVFELVNSSYRSIAPGKAMLNRTVAEVWPEIAPEVLPLLERVYRTGEPYYAKDTSLLVRRAPEATLEERSFTFAYVLIRGAQGHDDAIMVIVIESTEEVRARRKVEDLAEVAHERAAELQAVLENMVEAVFVCDTAGHVTLTNEAGVRLLGLPSQEEVRTALSEFPAMLRMRRLDGRPLGPEEMPLVRALAGETVIQDDEIVYNCRIQREVYVRTSAAPIRDERGAITGAVAVARDVTELTELDRLKDKFITVTAHELKTPAAIMKGYAQALLRTADDMPLPRRRMLDAINRGADRIDNIVKDLLDISRLHLSLLELTIERIDLPQFVQEVVDRAALTATKHRIRLARADPAVVQGDRHRLEQVLTNLIDNAIRYSPKGGDMEVEVAVRESEAIVSIRDYGVGIPEEKQARIFERFYRAHTGTPYDYGGMGVGLYISREIVMRHGGRMWFESEKDKGATFYFSLPL